MLSGRPVPRTSASAPRPGGAAFAGVPNVPNRPWSSFARAFHSRSGAAIFPFDSDQRPSPELRLLTTLSLAPRPAMATKPPFIVFSSFASGSQDAVGVPGGRRVTESEQQRPKIRRMADRPGAWYTPLAVGIGAIGGSAAIPRVFGPAGQAEEEPGQGLRGIANNRMVFMTGRGHILAPRHRARRFGIGGVYGNQSPEQKVDIVRQETVGGSGVRPTQ